VGIGVPTDWRPGVESPPAGAPFSLGPADMIYRYLDTVGDGSGTTDAIGNYATATAFKITPPSDRIFVLSRMIVQVVDNGNFDADKYGNNVTLTNGLLMCVRDSNEGILLDLCDNQAIKTNAGWAAVCYDSREDAYGTGNSYLSVRWTFSKSGAGIRIDGTQGQDFAVILEDNFSTLIKHVFMVQGWSYLA